MTPGTQTIDAILERFSKGQGVNLSKKYEVTGRVIAGKGTRTDTIEVYLIPQGLCKPNSNGLIIVAGKGHFVWDGSYRLTGYKLLGAGIMPMLLATDLAAIANAMLDRMVSIQSPEAVLAIEAPKA